jgi:hypothetical protein
MAKTLRIDGNNVIAGVVHANVGQKLLNCYPLRVFSSDQKLRI